MSKKVVRLTESDLKRIIKRVIKEQITGTNIKDCLESKIKDLDLGEDVAKIADCVMSVDLSDIFGAATKIAGCAANITFAQGTQLLKIAQECAQSAPSGTMSITKNTDMPTPPQASEEMGA